MYLIAFTFTLYTVYPRAGDESLPFVPEFNDPGLAIKRMLEFGFSGRTFAILLPDPDYPVSQLSIGRQIDLWLFAGIYFLCLVMLSILLLRLFMATLAATFNTARMAAQLEWRLQFARHVFRAELMHPNCFGSTACGEDIDGKRMYVKVTRTDLYIQNRQGAYTAGDVKRFVANDLDGDGVPDMATSATSEVVENDLDGDGFPDDAEHSIGAQNISQAGGAGNMNKPPDRM
jgi:hypothetical protein